MAFKLKSKGEILGINEELSSYNHPVFEKNLGENIIAEANRDGTTFVDKNASEAQKRNAIPEENEHHNQMQRGQLQYTNETVTWKKDTKSPSRVYTRMNGQVTAMNSPADKVIEGASGLPWEAAAKSKSYGK
jgi:archaellum component FlaG (FlaF/FlaG flagellin family)